MIFHVASRLQPNVPLAHLQATIAAIRHGRAERDNDRLGGPVPYVGHDRRQGSAYCHDRAHYEEWPELELVPAAAQPSQAPEKFM